MKGIILFFIILLIEGLICYYAPIQLFCIVIVGTILAYFYCEYLKKYKLKSGDDSEEK